MDFYVYAIKNDTITQVWVNQSGVLSLLNNGYEVLRSLTNQRAVNMESLVMWIDVEQRLVGDIVNNNR